LWIIYEGKPLIVIFDGGNLHPTMSPPLVDDRFTIRWMSSQFQLVRYDKLGYWSWMDGSIAPFPTFLNGTVEALTVTPAFFPPGGWLAPEAYGRLGGTTFVEQFKTAAQFPPLFLIINQWNEFAGQANGSPSYADTYSYDFSDDIEPTDMVICAYPRPGQRCHGWGFFYLNLLRALVALHEQGANANFTVLTVGNPEPGDVIGTPTTVVPINYIGVTPKAFYVTVNSVQVALVPPGTPSVEVDFSSFPNGWTTLTVTAEGAWTPYALSSTEVDIAAYPMITPSISIDIYLSL